jgi:thiol-disulfide isomerase/thioredoxin
MTDFALTVIKSGKPSVVVVYAPWCKFCQAMEEEYGKFADATSNMDLYKFRGDEVRDFVTQHLNTKCFPNVDVVTKDGKVIKYESKVRIVKAFQDFVKHTVA